MCSTNLQSFFCFNPLPTAIIKHTHTPIYNLILNPTNSLVGFDYYYSLYGMVWLPSNQFFTFSLSLSHSLYFSNNLGYLLINFTLTQWIIYSITIKKTVRVQNSQSYVYVYRQRRICNRMMKIFFLWLVFLCLFCIVQFDQLFIRKV